MIRSWVLHILFFALLMTAPTLAFAQSDEDLKAANVAAADQSRSDAEAQARQSMIDRGQAALQDFINSSPLPGVQLSPKAELDAKFRQFREAIPRFRDATNRYRLSLNSAGKTDKPRKDIESETDIMLRYLSAAKVKHPPVEPNEFKGLSQGELEREIVRSAELVASQAVSAVRAERQNTVSSKTLDFLYRFNGQLLRLRWLTSHVK